MSLHDPTQKKKKGYIVYIMTQGHCHTSDILRLDATVKDKDLPCSCCICWHLIFNKPGFAALTAT